MNNTYVNKDLQIENKFISLMTLIDTIYPVCNNKSTTSTKRYLCIHPHCNQRYTTKGALRFHISKSHLINHVKKPLLDPIIIPTRPKQQQQHIILLDTPSPPTSPFSSYKSPSSKKPILSSKAEKFLNSVYPPLQCPCCQQLFNRKTNVIKHLSSAHGGQEPYRCIYHQCQHTKLYATREGLVYHIARFHDNDK